MSLRQRLLARLADAYVRHQGVAGLADLLQEERQALRSLTGLFEVLARAPVYGAGLRHCVEVVDDILGGRPQGRLVCEVAATVLADVSDAYRAMGLRDEADKTAARGASLRRGAPIDGLLYVLGVLGETDAYTVDPRVSAALVHALLSDLPRSPRVKPASPLAAAVVTCYQSGNFDLMRKVTSAAAGKGSEGLALLLESLRPENRSAPSVDLPVATQFANLAQVIAEEDPAHQAVAVAARAEQERMNTLFGPGAARSVAARVEDAIRRDDYRAAALIYDEVSGDSSMSPSMRAQMMIFAMCARLLANLVDDASAVDAELDRLVRGRVLHARSVLDLQWALNWLIDQAVDIYRGGGSPLPAVEAFDLAAECQWGAAVSHENSTGLPDDERTLMSLMTRDATGLDIETLTAAHPDTAFVWVRIFNNENGLGVLHCVAAGSPGHCRVVRNDLDRPESSIVARSIGDSSEDLSGHEITWMRELVFGDLPPHTRHVVVVPDALAWNIPWSLLAPDHIASVAVAPSASAYHRVDSLPAGMRKIIAVVDEQLDGARQELATLTELANRGLVELTRAHSYRELADLLRRNRYDMLTVAVHGTSGDGFQYRLLLPDTATAPAALLQLPLPPVVVLGCCWSASSTEVPDTVASTVGCLAAGASTVIGGLWAIDDDATGALLSRMYENYKGGQRLGEALRAAYLELPADVRRRASGVSAIGRC